MRVLLVTDRPALADALSLFLREHGFEIIDVLSDPRRLSRRSAELTPDVVLIDWLRADAAWAQYRADAVAMLRRGDGSPPVVALGVSSDPAIAGPKGVDAFAILGDRPERLLQLLSEATGADSIVI
jgi:DNA-binding NarL/FixJ family response regulator